VISDQSKTLVTTYLETHSQLPIAERGLRNAKFEVRELKAADWKFNREMYFKVGESWRWIDKRPWTDEQWKAYASNPNLRTFAGYFENRLAGYYELHRDADTGIEIAYFGLLPKFIGCGLGGVLLTSAIENAWNWSSTPTRVWVHTCNRDHPNALANYKARGFRVYKIEREAAHG